MRTDPRIAHADCQPFFRDARALVLTLENANTSASQTPDQAAAQRQLQAIHRLFLFFHHTNPMFQHRAYACAYMGGVDALLRVEGDEQGGTMDEVRSEALVALGAMCFVNENVCELVVENQEFVRVVAETMHLREQVCYIMNNVAAYSWQSHKTLLPFAARAVDMLSQPQAVPISRHHKAWCVRLLGQLAYNQENRQTLLAVGALHVLLQVMSQCEIEMACCTAAVGAGCLLSENGAWDRIQPADQPLVQNAFSKKLASLLVNAFNSSLVGADFPRGSHVFYYPWKLAMGLSGLVTHKPFCVLLCSENFAGSLRIALTMASKAQKRTDQQNTPGEVDRGDLLNDIFGVNDEDEDTFNVQHSEQNNSDLIEHSLVALWRLQEQNQQDS